MFFLNEILIRLDIDEAWRWMALSKTVLEYFSQHFSTNWKENIPNCNPLQNKTENKHASVFERHHSPRRNSSIWNSLFVAGVAIFILRFADADEHTIQTRIRLTSSCNHFKSPSVSIWWFFLDYHRNSKSIEKISTIVPMLKPMSTHYLRSRPSIQIDFD